MMTSKHITIKKLVNLGFTPHACLYFQMAKFSFLKHLMFFSSFFFLHSCYALAPHSKVIKLVWTNLILPSNFNICCSLTTHVVQVHTHYHALYIVHNHNVYKFEQKQDNEIKNSSNYVNFLIDGMILFLKILLGT